MIIGGGPSPSSNQVSLERNVVFAQATIAAGNPNATDVALFFADGENSDRDLQYKDKATPTNDATKWAMRLYAHNVNPQMHYRNHELGATHKPAMKSDIERKLTQLSKTLKVGDRLFIYVTAHGGPAETEYYYDDTSSEADSENAYNTTIGLWNDESIDANDLSHLLDLFDAEVPITMIMTQCYAGGFAETIFNNADRRQGLNLRPRCGFFAQRHDRPAAGCTPEIDEASYQEYSTFFWAALSGKDRLGEPVEGADYNKDGKVQFSEAHAYTIIHSRTIDIPLAASESILRKYSRIPKSEVANEEKTTPKKSSGIFGGFFGGGNSTSEDKDTDNKDEVEKSADSHALGVSSTVAEIRKLANVEQQAILDALSKELEVESETNLADLRKRRAKAKQAADASQLRIATESKRMIESAEQLKKAVQLHWPELDEYQITPKLIELCSVQAEDFVAFINAHPASKAMKTRNESLKKVYKKYEAAEVNEALWFRLCNTLEVILLAENLPKIARNEIVEHYNRVVLLEHGQW